MQTFKSEYARKGIRVNDACPTYALRRRLGDIHVGTSDQAVEAIVRGAVMVQRLAGNDAWTDALEQEAVRYALWAHGENRAEYRWIMSGTIREGSNA